MKLSNMERRLLDCLGSDYVSSKILMDRLYVGLKRPNTNTISALVSRLRTKGINIESIRGKGYRRGSSAVDLVRNVALPRSFTQGGSITTEIKGMLSRYGLDFAIVAAVAMKALRAVATPTPKYLLTAPPKYDSVDYVQNAQGVYEPE